MSISNGSTTHQKIKTSTIHLVDEKSQVVIQRQYFKSCSMYYRQFRNDQLLQIKITMKYGKHIKKDEYTSMYYECWLAKNESDDTGNTRKNDQNAWSKWFTNHNKAVDNERNQCDKILMKKTMRTKTCKMVWIRMIMQIQIILIKLQITNWIVCNAHVNWGKSIGRKICYMYVTMVTVVKVDKIKILVMTHIASALNQFGNDNNNKYQNNESVKINSNVSSKYRSDSNNNWQ